MSQNRGTISPLTAVTKQNRFLSQVLLCSGLGGLCLGHSCGVLQKTYYYFNVLFITIHLGCRTPPPPESSAILGRMVDRDWFFSLHLNDDGHHHWGHLWSLFHILFHLSLPVLFSVHGWNCLSFVNKRPELPRGCLACPIFIQLFIPVSEFMKMYFILRETGVFLIEEQI